MEIRTLNQTKTRNLVLSAIFISLELAEGIDYRLLNQFYMELQEYNLKEYIKLINEKCK